MGFSSHGSKKGNHNHNHNYNSNYTNEDDDASIEKMRKEIEANQDSALSLCTEKVLLARQAYELVSFFSSFWAVFLYSFYI
jgi:inhibitor of growth protein 4